MPSSWTRYDLRLGVEKASLCLLLLLLALYWFIGHCSKPNRAPDMGKLELRDAYQKVTLGERIDLNRESAEGLMAIPKMTRKMAQKIVEYRNVYGPIQDEADLLKALGSRYKERIPEILSFVNLGME